MWFCTCSNTQASTKWHSCMPVYTHTYISSVQFSRSVVSNSLWLHGLQLTRLSCPSPTPRACSNSCPSSRWCHPTNSSSVIPFSSCLQSFSASGSFPISQLFASGAQSLEFQHKSFQWIFGANFLSDWLVWFPCSPRNSPTQQFRSIDCSVLSFLYSPTLTSIRDYWKNCSFD